MFERACRSKQRAHWDVYRLARNRAILRVRKAKAAFFGRQADILADPKCPASKWWKVAKNLCDLKGNSYVGVPPLLTASQQIVNDDKDKAEILNKVFINENTALRQDSFPVLPSCVRSVFSFQKIGASDVQQVINSLPNKLSAGPDQIPYKLLKEAGPGLIGPLTSLFNHSLERQQVPLEWKQAIISPVFKGGKKVRSNPLNYRPISLTSCVARVLEKLLNTQVLKYLLSNSLLFQHQSGFLPRHSTITQLCFLSHQWQETLDKGDHVQAAFLDLSKAYDRVAIPGLINKLSSLGFARSTLLWLSSFLFNRQQCVRLDGVQSSWQSPKSGIPQGTVLGPVLFLIFINDLPQSINGACSIFADDTTAYTSGKDPLSTCRDLSINLDSAWNWASEWGMMFSVEKSEHLEISSKNKPDTSPGVSMGRMSVPKVLTHKHLGVYFNSRLTWDTHIQAVYSSCARKVGILRRLRNKLRSATIRRIYVGAIRPKLEYACPVWSGGNTSKLETLQTSLCRSHQLSLPPLKKRFDYHSLVLFFKIILKVTPAYLNSLLPSRSSSSGYRFRKLSYPVPLVKKSATLQSFLPRTIIAWNDLPQSIQQCTTLSSFKHHLRQHLHV